MGSPKWWIDLGMADENGESSGLEAIGPWTELKHEIVQKYAAAYSRILTARKLHHVYVDAFAGAGRYVSKQSGLLVPGTPEIALGLQQPFREYHFIDIDEIKVSSLERLATARQDVMVHHGDCNVILVDKVLPRIRWSDYRRGLCILDPYGLHLNWRTIQSVAETGTTEIFLNFPVMDINRNALRREPDKIAPEQARRMTMFWGDESWRTDFYRPALQMDLFGNQPEGKAATNEMVAETYRQRLREVAGFEFVPVPLPMRNSTNAIVYYLFFASHKAVAGDIVEQIFAKYRM